MSKYEKFYEDEQKKIGLRRDLAIKLMDHWKVDLDKALNSDATLSSKVDYLMGTGPAKKIISLSFASEKSLKTILEKFLTSMDTNWLVNKIVDLSEATTIKQDLEKQRKPLTSIIPKKILDFLPEKLVVDVDPQGQIKDLYSRYANKDKNIGVKIQKQKDFVKVRAKFEQLLDKGMLSSNNKVKMMSLIIAVMYDTGIRPGDDDTGLSYTSIETEGPETTDKKGPKPARELVTTYGSISLEPQHFKVLNGVTNLAFYGKSGVYNKAQISNHLLNSVIKEVIMKFAMEGEPGKPLFSVDGVAYSSGQLQNFYVGLLKLAGMKDITGHSMTDLRKLKSTTVLHKALLEAKDELQDQILKIENVFSKKALTQITSMIADALNKAVEKSEVALNHTSMNMTINSYINPQLILNFLSNSGEIESDLSELLHSDGKLQFDVKDFVVKAAQSRFVDNGGWESVVESEDQLGVLPEQDEFAGQYSLLGRRYASLNTRKIIVDRIEGRIAVCIMGKSYIELPLSFLPKGVKEGMVVEVNMVVKAMPKGIVKNRIKQLSVGDTGGDFSI
jgi:hypothetical protein